MLIETTGNQFVSLENNHDSYCLFEFLEKKLYDEIENIVSISFFFNLCIKNKTTTKGKKKKNGKEPALEKS
jgi:hypothetical protein